MLYNSILKLRILNMVKTLSKHLLLIFVNVKRNGQQNIIDEKVKQIKKLLRMKKFY